MNAIKGDVIRVTVTKGDVITINTNIINVRHNKGLFGCVLDR